MTKRDFLKKVNVIKEGNRFYVVVFQIMCKKRNADPIRLDLFFDKDEANEVRRRMSERLPECFLYLHERRIY